MALNCRTGDLAVIVRSEAGNEGKIVRCLRFAGELLFLCKTGELERLPAWEVDVDLIDWAGNANNEVDDASLRPIRDNDGTDEMLRIAGLPRDSRQPLEA